RVEHAEEVGVVPDVRAEQREQRCFVGARQAPSYHRAVRIERGGHTVGVAQCQWGVQIRPGRRTTSRGAPASTNGNGRTGRFAETHRQPFEVYRGNYRLFEMERAGVEPATRSVRPRLDRALCIRGTVPWTCSR